MSDVWGFRDLVPERAANLQPLGFTERQARFVVTVMLHSGVFLERQYCRFAGITHGQKTHNFIDRLIGRGFAREVRPGALHRGRLYHVHHTGSFTPRVSLLDQALVWCSTVPENFPDRAGYRTLILWE